MRDYLVSLGARTDPDRVSRMVADGWNVEWASQRERVAGSVLTLTQFDLVFTGESPAVEEIHRQFMAKAQRGGG